MLSVNHNARTPLNDCYPGGHLGILPLRTHPDFLLQSESIGLLSIYLHKDRRIVSLVLITILALMVYSIIELLCRRGGYQITARTALEYFEKLNVVYIKDEEGWSIS